MKNNVKIILESFELINFYFKMKNSIILTTLVFFHKTDCIKFDIHSDHFNN